MENQYGDRGFGYYRDILKRSKPIDELVVEEIFLVEGYLSESKLMKVVVDTQPRDDNNDPIGPDGKLFDDVYNDHSYMQIYKAGIYTRNVLTVKALNDACPVTTLLFEGVLPDIVGKKISAKIFIGEYSPHIKRITKHFPDGGNIRIPVNLYVDRLYNATESAIDIKVHHSDTLFATYRSDEYANYFNDSLFPKEL